MSFAVVAGETNGFTLFKNQRQLVCYASYDVIQNQSGAKTGKSRISKKGNSHIRRILHMAALSAVRNKVPIFYNLYQRVYERTGIKMKAYTAVQRKLLVIMYTLWKTEQKFDPEFGISDIHKSEILFSVDTMKNHTKTADHNESAALDRHPCNQSPGVLFSVS